LCCVSAVAQPHYQETFLKVILNGEEVAQNALALKAIDGSIALRASDLRLWRVRLPSESKISFGDEEFIPLIAFPAAFFEIDPTTLSLTIDLPPAAFEPTLITTRPLIPAPQGGAGAYLNYDLLHSDAERSGKVTSGVAELVMFATPKWGVLTNSVLLNDLGDPANSTRLASFWSKDLVNRRESITIGDGFTTASALAVPARFGGVQWGTNFSVDPGFVSVPTTSIVGITERQAVVELFVDGALRQTSSVPAGPFEIEQVSGMTGQGEMQLVITDLLGRQQVIIQPYYLGPTNLSRGVEDYSIQAGVIRRNYGKASTDYGSEFAGADYRRGLTDRVTLGGHVEVMQTFKVGGVEGAFVMPGFGTLGLTALMSSSSENSGWRTGLSFDYRTRHYGFGFASKWTTRDFRQIGLREGTLPTSREGRAYFNFSMGSRGSLGVNWVKRVLRGEDSQSLVSAMYTVNLGFTTLLLQGVRVYEPDPATTLNLTMVIPLGLSRSAQVGGVWKRDGRTGFVQYQKALGQADTGYAYRFRAENSAHTIRSSALYDGSLALHGSNGRIAIDAAYYGDSFNYRAGLNGGLAFMNGDIFLTRSIRHGLAVVDTGGVGGITVYRDNHEVGLTDKNGRIVVPQLHPYYGNRLRIDPLDAPLDTTVDEIEKFAVPYMRAGVVVRFPIKQSRSVTLTLVDSAGGFIPAGSIVRAGSVAAHEPVARDGFLYLRDLDIGQTTFSVDRGAQTCQFTLDISQHSEPLAHLGYVTCH